MSSKFVRKLTCKFEWVVISMAISYSRLKPFYFYPFLSGGLCYWCLVVRFQPWPGWWLCAISLRVLGQWERFYERFSCVKGAKRKWDKRHYCVYCKKPPSKMARHLQRKHSSEKEVALALCHPAKSKQSRQMLEDLRRKGNNNNDVLNEGKGEIVAYRTCWSRWLFTMQHMFWFFKRAELWKHEKLCRKTGEPEVESKQRGRVQTAASSLLPCKGQSSQRCAEIVSRMVFDKVSPSKKWPTHLWIWRQTAGEIGWWSIKGWSCQSEDERVG